MFDQIYIWSPEVSVLVLRLDVSCRHPWGQDPSLQVWSPSLPGWDPPTTFLQPEQLQRTQLSQSPAAFYTLDKGCAAEPTPNSSAPQLWHAQS